MKPLLIVSDIHHRVSGVSASIRSLLPHLKQRYQVLFVAKQDHSLFKAQKLIEVYRLLSRWRAADNPVWHVRRNNEMLWGLLFRTFVCRQLKLVFTSAAIRRHSAWPRYLIAKMDAVIATSTKAAALVPNVKAIVPHGVDVNYFESAISEQEFPWRKFDHVIGIIGRVRPEKGTDLYAHAISGLLAQHPQACALLVGKTTAKYQSFLQGLKTQWQAAGVLDRVFVLDEVPLTDMPALYESIDIVCAPARYEGFGLVPLEAMVSGTAIIASKTGAYEDMVEPNLNGLLVECGNQQQLTDALSQLLCDPEKIIAFKEQGKHIVRTRFSLTGEVEQNCKVYDQMRES